KTKLDNNFIIFTLISIGLFYLWSLDNGQYKGFVLDLNMKVLFPTWLVYFGIAYFIGTYYDNFSKLIAKTLFLILACILFVFSIMLIKFNYGNGNQSVHSRRMDLIPYVTTFSIILMYIGKTLPHLFIIKYLSKYAFGIYLL